MRYEAAGGVREGGSNIDSWYGSTGGGASLRPRLPPSAPPTNPPTNASRIASTKVIRMLEIIVVVTTWGVTELGFTPCDCAVFLNDCTVASKFAKAKTPLTITVSKALIAPVNSPAQTPVAVPPVR